MLPHNRVIWYYKGLPEIDIEIPFAEFYEDITFPADAEPSGWGHRRPASPSTAFRAELYSAKALSR